MKEVGQMMKMAMHSVALKKLLVTRHGKFFK